MSTQSTRDYSTPLAPQCEDEHRAKAMRLAQEEYKHTMSHWFMDAYPAPRSLCVFCNADLWWHGYGDALIHRCGERRASWWRRLRWRKALRQ